MTRSLVAFRWSILLLDFMITIELYLLYPPPLLLSLKELSYYTFYINSGPTRLHLSLVTDLTVPKRHTLIYVTLSSSPANHCWYHSLSCIFSCIRIRC